MGWIKRGPSGVIGTNKKDAADTVARMIEDRDAGALHTPPMPDADDTAAWLADRAPDAVTWEGWQAIDEHEQPRGRAAGPPAGQARAAGRPGGGRAAQRGALSRGRIVSRRSRT